jgi:hypothetical protein
VPPIPPAAAEAFNAFTRFVKDGNRAHIAHLSAEAIEGMLAVFAQDAGSPAYVAGQQRLETLRREAGERQNRGRVWKERAWGIAIGFVASLMAAGVWAWACTH